ncbi:DEAD/DEAH box helicase [Clostridium kluyveri]|uniref:Helicase ATP-binding domain-containing protein n=1 Tax=Clostridium kluyveri TaxID=1534 RepID=A0A1L5FAX3_CLOKL|nr:DEAD/DEAH box helicase family protein [Clostridium kluyveri]APM40165.1 hypothetical protein BS101_16160 [Clostridium kluyveri]
MNQEIKVRLCKKSYNPLDDDMVEIIEPDSKYVTDGIGQNFKYWTSRNPVFISAQTGMGKNTFVENVLIEDALQNNYRILIISNRVASNRQQKERIAKVTGCEVYLEDYTPKGLDKIELFGNIRIMTYQKLGNSLSTFSANEYSIVVFDECHFFISDALFNNKTNEIFKKSIDTFQNSLRIYMTSTPDEIFSLILEEEKKLMYTLEYALYQNINSYQYFKKILYYNFKRDYSYICTRYFNSKEEILDLIKKDGSEYKSIIFINSKISGKKILERIGSNNAVFITAESKDSQDTDGKIYTEIVNEKKFNSQILVCTSVLDNGINLKDPLLKNIIIFSYDKTEFLQMLGRKRITDDEKINLYLYRGKVEEINAKLSIIKKQCGFINGFNSNPVSFLNKNFTNNDIYKGLFYFNKCQKLCLNELAEKKLCNNKSFLERIIDSLNGGDKEAFILEQLSWIGLKETYNPSSYINYVDPDKNKANFINFLDKYCGIPLLDDELDSFEKEFKILTTAAYGMQEGDRQDRPNYKATKMRKIFKNYNLNYNIKIKDKVSTLVKDVK